MLDDQSLEAGLDSDGDSLRLLGLALDRVDHPVAERLTGPAPGCAVRHAVGARPAAGEVLELGLSPVFAMPLVPGAAFPAAVTMT